MGLTGYITGQTFANPIVRAYMNNQFLATYKGQTRTWSMNFKGNPALSSYQVNVMKWKFFDSKAVTTFNAVRRFSTNVNLLSSAMIVADMSANGINVGNTQGLVFNSISYMGIPGSIIGTTYSVVQMGLPTGNPAEMQRLGQGAVQGQIMHPYQAMGRLGVSLPIK